MSRATPTSTAKPTEQQSTAACPTLRAAHDGAVYAEVDDIEASLAKAVGLGATVVQEPTDVPGVTICLLADPQGNIVGIAQPRSQPG